MLVFTLGLTETWRARADGAVYPLCPGVAGGVFDPELYEFVNLGVDAVVTDMTEAIALIRAKNPEAKIILTVSPVPLIATMEDRSVLVSTTYSKSVLRVAAETITQRHTGVAYFPSYEIITGAFSRGRYYGDDLRDVTPEGVAHVMRLFMQHYAADDDTREIAPLAEDAARQARADQVARNLQAMAAVICDEIALDPVPAQPTATEQRVTDPVLTPAPVEPPQPGSAMAYLRDTAAAPPGDPPENTAPPEPARPRGLFSWARRR